MKELESETKKRRRPNKGTRTGNRIRRAGLGSTYHEARAEKRLLGGIKIQFGKNNT